MAFNRGLDTARIALKLGLGLAAFLAGLDKFFNVLADWQAYLSPYLKAALPLSATSFLYAVGVVEMAVGLAILTRWTAYASYVAGAWLILIAINLLTTGQYFDVAVRDVEMAIGAYALARLTEAKEAVGHVAPSTKAATRTAA